ncbi:hypothetical protein [Nocardia cyriacigeorgica]|uniref:Uncharacterized protein n=1 Tax=Nocardia cyriacigeorgica TaxID=135487 RepID=A0A5R8NFQ5_9NOCA|nr:hypothetical protein [Nocardia cyriacigeorgica]TLF74488.1 hypothetical protein FEK34_24315 [Nocardia cyriacigeorgica]
MADLSVELAVLAGFATDLAELKSCSISNTSHLLPAVALPTGSTGLMAALEASIERFGNEVGAALDAEITTIGNLCTSLTTTAASFESTDEAISANISNAGSDLSPAGTQSTSAASQGVSRFSALQLPSLPGVSDNPYTLRQLVETAIGLLAVYDDRLNAAIGIRPTVDLLSPLVADWESLQPIGKRIALLGINDYVTSENLINGTNWLQDSWSGEAARNFAERSNNLGQAVGARSLDFDAVSKIVENGGAYLERMVYNQVADICDKVLHPMTLYGATFPLGAWAPHINNPIREPHKSELLAALNALESSITLRQGQIQTMVDKLSAALDYVPGRSIPTFISTEFDLPDKITIDLGARKFGYGDNMWWEDRIDSLF